VKWTRGQETVDRLLAEARLELVTGAAADGTTWLVSAAALLESARRESGRNAEAAYVLAYDATRKASTAPVAQQGLRTKGVGHHVTVEQVVRAQFGGPFEAFGALRRRRSEIEYPQRPGDDIEPAEAATAISAGALIIAAAEQLQPRLDLYR